MAPTARFPPVVVFGAWENRYYGLGGNMGDLWNGKEG